MHVLLMFTGSTRRYNQARVCNADWTSHSMHGECCDLKVCVGVWWGRGYVCVYLCVCVCVCVCVHVRLRTIFYNFMTF